MAMDLFALHPATPEYTRHEISWNRWGVLRDLLVELAAPVGEMSFTNNGEIVTEITARRWAGLLTGSEHRVFEVRYPDAGYASGFRVELHVDGTDTPVALASAEVERALLRTEPPPRRCPTSRRSPLPSPTPLRRRRGCGPQPRSSRTREGSVSTYLARVDRTVHPGTIAFGGFA